MATKYCATTATAQKVSLENALIKCKHNAALIAAAPEMLKILIAIAPDIRGEMRAMVDNVIKKAEGR